MFQPSFRLLCAAVSLFLLSGLQAFSQTKKTTPSKSTTAKSASAKPAPHATTGKAVNTSKTATAKGNTKGKKPATPAKVWVQTQPSPSRYKEIQQALADKGYFGGMPDGNWGSDSAEALKRFQKDQNLEVDGKIGSLSLIALGLGPKRGTQAAAAAPSPSSPANQPEQ